MDVQHKLSARIWLKSFGKAAINWLWWEMEKNVKAFVELENNIVSIFSTEKKW